MLLAGDTSAMTGREDMLVEVFELLAADGTDDVVGTGFGLLYITGALLLGR